MDPVVLAALVTAIGGVIAALITARRNNDKKAEKLSASATSTFHKIPLPDSRRFDLPWGNEPNPPLEYCFNNVPFLFREGTANRINGTQISFGDEITVSVDIPNAKAIYFMLNAEYAFHDLGKAVSGRYRQIGEITLTFSNGTTLSEPLIMGVNIRDWCFNNSSAITTLEPNHHHVIQAWRATGERGLIMDMLTVEWKNTSHLKSVTIRNHLSSEITPDSKPGILVWAITCKVI